MKDYIENIKGAERRFYSYEMRVAKDSRDIDGLGIVYNSLSENFAPWIEGGLYEVIDRGAAKGLLDDPDIMILFNHDPSLVLARNKNTAELIDTDEGVRYRFTAPNTNVGNDFLVNVQNQNIRKSSFAFIPKEVKQERGIEWPNMGRINVRHIVRFEALKDFSGVTYPAYNKTEVLARNFQQVIDEEVRAIKEEQDRQVKNRQVQHELTKLKLAIF